MYANDANAAAKVVLSALASYAGHFGAENAVHTICCMGAAGNWLHTGDQGFLDKENFVTLTGRIKELINRGGEKISPIEVGLTSCHATRDSYAS